MEGKMIKRKLTLNTWAENESITLDESFKLYKQTAIANGIKKKTLDGYEVNYNQVKKYIDEKTEIKYTSEITSNFITEYILYLREEKPHLRDTSIHSMITKTRAFFYFCMEQDHMQNFRIKSIRFKEKRKDIHTEEEQIKLLEKPKQWKNFPEYRNWVIVYHILATGNRSRTVRSIQMKDVKLQEKFIEINETKNDEIYQLPICEVYYPILKEYYNLRIRQGAKPDNYLFASQRETMLGEHGFNTTMTRYFLSRGIKKTSVHLLRHTFATKWLINGGSRAKLQKVLGHKTSAMVDKYSHITGIDIKDDYNQFTPLNNVQDKIKPKNRLRLK